MKFRNGFVSNSSSSSFVILLNKITAEQLYKILNHATVGTALGIPYADTDAWDIQVTDAAVRGTTSMDNFNMVKLFECIGVASSDVEWSYD